MLTADTLRFFDWIHLPNDLQLVSKPFYHLAVDLVDTLPDTRETQKAIDKLLEAKDCAVRSALDLRNANPNPHLSTETFNKMQEKYGGTPLAAQEFGDPDGE